MTRTNAAGLALVLMVLGGCKAPSDPQVAEAVASPTTRPAGRTATRPEQKGSTMPDKVVKSDAEWRHCLSPEQYHVMREKGTERAFTGKYHDTHEQGVYLCAACGNELFSSDTKFESGSGWPSFFKPLSPDSVGTESDTAHGMVRTEVTCARCGAHLGHVFDDGPRPTGLRYCMNSVSLQLKPAKE